MSSASGNDTTNNVTSTPNWQMPALLFGLAAPIGYAAAYLREWGFCHVFGIPIEFIQLSVTTVLIAITSGIAVMFLLFWFADLFYMFTQRRNPKRSAPIRRRVFFDALYLIFFGCLFGLFPVIIQYWPLPAFFFVALIFNQFLLPLITQTNIAGYINKLEALDQMDRETTGLLDYFAKRAGRAFIFFGIAVLLFLGSMFLTGYQTALTQTDFLVPSTNEDLVVLRIYGDNLVCAHYDIETKKAYKTFIVIKSDDEPRPILRLVRLGPLVSPNIWTIEPQD